MRGLWKGVIEEYRNYLPVSEKTPVVTLNEGNTPLIHAPRLASPRLRVPAGAVGIAGGQTGIYPLDSPGGWHIVGRCPVPLFDPRRARPALLSVGDRIRFRPVPEDEADAIASAFAEGRGAPEAFVQGPT